MTRHSLAALIIVVAACSTSSNSTVVQPPQRGTIIGAVSKASGGALRGITVSADPSGASALPSIVTDSLGHYTIPNVPAGNGSVVVAGVPANCQTPPTEAYSITPPDSTTINFSVTCTSPDTATGTIQGLVQGSYGSTGIPNAVLTVTPTGQSAVPSTTTDAYGNFELTSVPAGPGTISVSQVPGNCTAPAPTNYTLPANNLIYLTIPIQCQGVPPVLWMGGFDGVYGLTASQIAQSDSAAPLSLEVTPGTMGVVYDGSGNLWVANGGTLVEYTPAQLAVAGNSITPTVTITVPNGTGATILYGLAFDQNGTLWAAQSDASTLLGYSAAQLTASGSPTPAHVLTLSAHHPNGIAFDASGNLWVASPAAGDVQKYTPAQLTPATATVTPVDSIVGGVGKTPVVGIARWLAFDAGGDLWVSGSTDSAVKFSAATLASLGPSTSVLTPDAILELASPIQGPGGLTFDQAGNLWISDLLNSGVAVLLRYPSSAQRTGGTPDVTVILGHGSNGLGPGEAQGLAFAPGFVPSTSRVAGPRIRAAPRRVRATWRP